MTTWNVKNSKPLVVVVDDFLGNPDEIRALALKQDYKPQGSKGVRSLDRFAHPNLVPCFEQLIDRKILEWGLGANGRFQHCNAETPLVHHCDLQTHAASIFLTPDAPPGCGLKLLRSKKFGLRYGPTQEFAKARNMTQAQVHAEMFGGFYDSTLWETVDQIGNVYNRLVIWDAQHAHTAACYFGQHINDSRLFQVFFFNAR